MMRLRAAAFVQHQHGADIGMLHQAFEDAGHMIIETRSGISDGFGSGATVRSHDVACDRSRPFAQRD